MMSRYATLYFLVAAVALLAPGRVAAADATRSVFGTMPEGRKVAAVTLSNAHGVRVRVIALGARVQSVMLPDRDGHVADVALGYPGLEGYLKKPQYFGATVGRYANRLAKGRFTLDGKTYQVPTNDGPNSLHGGPEGFSTKLWKVKNVESGPHRASVAFRYVSPDGDMGFPGTLTVTATYTLDAHNRLTIDYKATTDKPTIVNITNHTYWNLAGEGSGGVMDQLLTIHADAYTPVDATQIPTGDIVPVAGTPFDFRDAKPIGRDIRDGHSKQLLIGHGYDMNWVTSRKPVDHLRVVAKVVDPESGRVLTLSSNQPGLQFYSGNFLDGTTVGKSGHIYRQGDALVLEPQLFPDAPNHSNFSSARLNPGQTYHNILVYRFSTNSAKSASSAP